MSKEAYVINGFYMSMREKYTKPSAKIHYFVVEWDGDQLCWEDFRGQVLGATDPETAVAGSLRRLILEQWEELGLASKPDVGDNGVHASASPFEALAERMNWLGTSLQDDSFGKAMLTNIPRDTILAWTKDPQIQLAGAAKSCFDSLEDTNSQECLNIAQKIAGQEETKLERNTNTAFVFIKPHAACSDKTASLVLEVFKGRGFTVLSEGEISGTVIEEKKYIDNHYYAIANKAALSKPAELHPSPQAQEEFKTLFGLGWEDALSQRLVYNAVDGCKYFGVDGKTMDNLWAKAKKAKRLVKFGGGFYAGKIDTSEVQERVKVCVFGEGTFGTAVGTLFARNGHEVVLLARRPHRVDSINSQRKNPDYLKEYTLHENISATTDAAAAIANAALIVHSIPVQASSAYLSDKRDLIPPHVPVVSLSKGIHLTNLNFMCHIIEDALQRKQPCAFFSGPSFARELMDGQPTGIVVASEDAAVAARVQRLVGSSVIRVYTSTDVIGVEVGGALKNIYAIAAGAAEGMGFKLNTAALIITRGCSEMKKLAVALGARPATVSGLSGIGDLMLTCFGGASRNRTVGVRLGKGEKLQDILESMGEVAEGVPTAGAALKLVKQLGLDLPITTTVGEVLEGIKPFSALTDLMQLPLKEED